MRQNQRWLFAPGGMVPSWDGPEFKSHRLFWGAADPERHAPELAIHIVEVGSRGETAILRFRDRVPLCSAKGMLAADRQFDYPLVNHNRDFVLVRTVRR